MKLFEIDPDTNEVKMNKPWIKLIPEFKALFSGYTMKGVPVRMDYDVKGIQRLTYIYFMLDLGSPIAEWEVEKKKAEALVYSGLTANEITPVVESALKKYEELQNELCRPLRTYRKLLLGMDKMDTYLETIDFNATDKMGKLLYTTDMYTKTVKDVNASYDSLDRLRKRVEEEMSAQVNVRGSATLGDREIRNKTDQTPMDVDTAPQNADTIKWINIEDIIKPKTNGVA